MIVIMLHYWWNINFPWISSIILQYVEVAPKNKLFLCGDFGYDDTSFSILQTWHGDLVDVHPSLVLQVSFG